MFIGTDPEYAICEKENNFPVPMPYFFEKGIKAIYIDKEQKHPVIYRNKDFKVIMDGVAFELTLPPAKNPKDLYFSLQRAFDWLENFALKNDFNFVAKPTLPYNPHKWIKNGLIWHQCNIFGCDRDYDAIIPDYDSPEIDALNHFFRYFGGHIHVSDEDNYLFNNILPAIHFMAITVGNYCVASSKYPEEEIQRAKLYGQPGRFRPQIYSKTIKGLEYRSPSNQWTTSLETIEGVFYWINRSIEFLKEKRTDILNEFLPQTIENIQMSNKEKAKQILEVL